MARRLSVARSGTWGAIKLFIEAVSLLPAADSSHATPLVTKLAKRGRGRMIHL